MTNQRVRARVGFAVLCLVVPVQFVVKAVASEPYPGLFMPSFNAVPAPDGKFSLKTMDVTVLFADGEPARIGINQLIASNDATPNSSFPSMFDTHLDVTDPRTVAWFRGRAAELFPHQHAETFVVDVYRTTYSLADRSVIERHRLRSHRVEVG